MWDPAVAAGLPVTSPSHLDVAALVAVIAAVPAADVAALASVEDAAESAAVPPPVPARLLGTALAPQVTEVLA